MLDNLPVKCPKCETIVRNYSCMDGNANHRTYLCHKCNNFFNIEISVNKPEETKIVTSFLCPKCRSEISISICNSTIDIYNSHKQPEEKKSENLFYGVYECNLYPEICICAAVIATDGTIIRGQRHRDCRDSIVKRGKNPGKEWESEGFITSSGRFVNREEGFKLMQSVKWESKNPQGYQACGWLFSEDLY